MSALDVRGFHFANARQWQACRFIQVDMAAARDSRIRPLAPFARPGALQGSAGAHAPVVTGAGDVLWRDDLGYIHRDSACDNAPAIQTPPPPIVRARRIVASRDSLWAVDGLSTVSRYEADSFTRVLAVEIAGAEIVDIASGGPDSVMVLFKRDRRWQCVRISNAGRTSQPVRFEGVSLVTAFIFLRREQRFVILAGRPGQLYWFKATGGRAMFGIPVAAQRPCFSASALGTDGRDRAFVAGVEGCDCGGAISVLIFDADGNALGDVPIDRSHGSVSGLTATRDRLLVATSAGLVTFRSAETVPDDVASARCTIITPVLRSPEQPDGRRWLRIEATADLPEGSTLELAYASTGSKEIRDRVEAILNNSGVPESRRVEQLLSEPNFWHRPTEFHGNAAPSPFKSPLSAKLFDVKDPFVWVSATLHAAPGAHIPALSKLSVLYPGRTLMASLPAIYQAEEERPDSFLRGLVGVLEATTQTLDARIATMGSQIHPATAPEAWLDFIARWLGLPWDDGMTIAQKRAIVDHAPELAKARGTRAGLETLMRALLPDSPQSGSRRFRVTDATADFGFAIVGGGTCPGSTLPAMLGGRTEWSAELGSRSVLGYMRLPCPGQHDDGVRELTGKVRLEIGATAVDRERWRSWLPRVVAELVPLTAHLDIRWVNPGALRSDRLDGTLTLESTPMPHLGNDALTGIARLPQRGLRLSSSGPGLSTSLR
jgi:phage tail-like protein